MPGKLKNNEDKLTKLTRIGQDFENEIQHIKDKRLELKIDEKKKSTRVLTNLLIKHDLWNKVKKDMINFKFKDEVEKPIFNGENKK